MKYFKIISTVWFLTILGALIAYFLQIYLSRVLGVEKYGAYSSLMSLANVSISFVSFGVSGFALRVFSQEGKKAYRWTKYIFRYLMLLSFLNVIVLFAVFHYDSTGSIFFVFYIYSFLFIEMFYLKTRIEGSFYLFAVWQAIPHAFRAVCVFIFVGVYGQDLNVVYSGLLFSSVLLIAFLVRPAILFFRNKMTLLYEKTEYFSTEKETTLNVLKRSFPFGLMALFYSLYTVFPVYFVSKVSGDYYAGLLSVVMSIILGVYILPSTIFQKVMMPEIQNKLVNNFNEAVILYKKSRVLMLIIGLFVAFVLFCFAEDIVLFVYGEGYYDSIVLLRVFSVCIPLRFINSSAGAFLNSEESVLYKCRVMFFCALVSLLILLVFTNKLGYLVSGGAMVVIEIIMLFSFTRYVRSNVFKVTEI